MPHPRSLIFLLAVASAACAPGRTVSSEESTRADAPETFRTEGRRLLDRCGEEVVLRGVNRMVVWFDRRASSFPEIARTGANAVRIVWTTQAPVTELEVPIRVALENGMIPMIELHDATGRWERLPDLVDWWVRPETVGLIGRYERDLLVNIANEAGDASVTDEQFRNGYREAVRRMREAGIRTPLVIDAANWGRNEQQLLRTAPYLLEQDPLRNLIFSVHWWHSDNDTLRITHTFESFVDREVPFLVGEFAHAEVGCRGRIAYEHIMKEAQRLGIGWLAWSWGPGNSDCPGMDMTRDGTFDTLQDWGLEVAVTDPNSIRNTSVRLHSIVHGTCRSGT